MKEDKQTKVVSIRLPQNEYEKLESVSKTLGWSVAQTLKVCIHCGLLLCEAKENELQ